MAESVFNNYSLGYLGVTSFTPPNFISLEKAPTTDDYYNFNVGTLWLDITGSHQDPPVIPEISDLYILVKLNNHVATWVPFTSGNLRFLTGDSGGLVSPDGNKNINTLGTANRITVTGNPGTNTLTWDIGAFIADTYVCDVGSATPAANILNVLGDGVNTDTSGAGNTITIDSAPGSSAFMADITANIDNVTGNGTGYLILFDRTIFNRGSDFDTSTGIYTVPSDGIYYFATTVTVSEVGTASLNRIGFSVDNSTEVWECIDVELSAIEAAITGFWRFNASITLPLDAGQTVQVLIRAQAAGGDTVDVESGGSSPAVTWFSGSKIANK